MDIKLSVVLAIIVAGIFPALSIYTWQAKPMEYSEEGAIDLALHFLRNSPTYRFDGIPESVRVTGAYRARTPVPTWLVTIEFECRHSGYGDRTGQVLLQVITSHTIGVIVEEGRVIRATIDGVWDEIAQKMIEEEGGVYTENDAVETALRFLRNGPTFEFDGISDSIRVGGVETLRRPYTWEVTIAFQCLHAGYGDRTGKMLAQVITPHEIRVVVEEDRVVRAIVDDKWDELEHREHVQGELLPPESARDAAIEYMLRTHEGLGGLRAPSSWESRDLTPGLVGASNLQYIGDGWIVNVSYPVVLRPIYTVEIEYTGEVSIHWKGTVDQEGAVDELEYTVAR